MCVAWKLLQETRRRIYMQLYLAGDGIGQKVTPFSITAAAVSSQEDSIPSILADRSSVIIYHYKIRIEWKGSNRKEIQPSIRSFLCD